MDTIFTGFDDYIRSAQVVAQQIHHVKYVIQRGLQYLLLRREFYMNVRAVPSLPLKRT